MNTEISVSCSSDQTINETPLSVPQMNYEDENSVIIWYQNQNESNENIFQFNMNNNEDFIDIDMFPEWSEHEESHEDISQISPHNITVDDTHIVNSTQQEDCENVEFSSRSESHQLEMLSSVNDHLDNLSLKEDGNKLSDSKLKYKISFSNTINMSCYIDGLALILQKILKTEDFMGNLAQITNDCKCTPSLRKGNVRLSHYLLEVSGASCENCSMDFIVEKLNTIFLKNIARAEFISVSQILESCRLEYANKIGATSKSSRYLSSNKCHLETDWLRKWLSRRLSPGVVAAIIYNDLIADNFSSRPCNGVKFRLVTDFTDSELRDNIEYQLLKEESINVPKSNILKCQLQNEDFEMILNQRDPRFGEMNVLGQIVGTFREKSSDSFKDFVPDEIHHIKIPNMHRNGVMLIVNV